MWKKRDTELCSFAHLPGVFLLLRQRRVAAGKGLGTGLGTTITYVRPELRPATHLVEGRSPRVLPCLYAHKAYNINSVPLLIF